MFLVETNRFNQRCGQSGGCRNFFPTGIYISHCLRSALVISFSNCSLVAVALAGSARMTTSTPAGSLGMSVMHTWRSRREVRWRTTAFPTALETMRPNRGPVAATSAGLSMVPLEFALMVSRACTTTVRVPCRRLPFIVRRNCGGDVSLWWAGSMIYADSFARPFLRRAATIARPERVLIRVRKPCLRARRRLFGWNVRLPFATSILLEVVRGHTAAVKRQHIH